LSISITERLAVKTAGATALEKEKEPLFTPEEKAKKSTPTRMLFMEDPCKQPLSTEASLLGFVGTSRAS